MRKLLALTCVVLGLGLPACGGGDDPEPMPTPIPTYEPGAAPAYQNDSNILGPAGDARNTVDQLDDLQERTENQTEYGP